ncbi:MAG: DNA-directed RNA polymerase subunit N [Bradyrhizobium sp.]
MKKQIAIAAMAVTVSTAAVAGERATGAALGAVSGAVVLGPIGAVAGAFIGYTAGPSMSRAWGVRGNSSARAPRRTANNEARSYRESQAAMGGPSAAPAAPPAPRAKAPPVQPLE